MAQRMTSARSRRPKGRAATTRRGAISQEQDDTRADVALDASVRNTSGAWNTVASALAQTDVVTRSRIMVQLQRQQGNAYVQRGVRDWVVEQWQNLKLAVGAEPPEEKLLSDLNSGLERAKKVCEIGSGLTSDRAASERLAAAGARFGQISGAIGTGLKLKGTARDIVQFIDAIETLEGLDIQNDQEKAAVAFGKLFAATGRLGQKLPSGPWSAYFEWLAQCENFFVNMRKKINPYQRWKTQFDELGISED